MRKTKPIINIVIENEQPVTTSRNVAENFDKRHDHILRDIEKLLLEDRPSFGEMFKGGTKPDSYGRQQKVYYMNRDGFSFLVMSFTGSEANKFKLAYIDQFNKMEKEIKSQFDTSQLSPELQMFNQVFKTLANQEVKTKQLESKVDGISDLVQIDTNDWRKEAVTIIRKIVVNQGGYDRMSELFNESYERLEDKARCNLNIRLNNKEKNMLAQGMNKTAIKKLNKLDVIQEDHRLIQIYMSVVKDMAIKYRTWEE